jgi:hypothetical protein
LQNSPLRDWGGARRAPREGWGPQRKRARQQRPCERGAAKHSVINNARTKQQQGSQLNVYIDGAGRTKSTIYIYFYCILIWGNYTFFLGLDGSRWVGLLFSPQLCDVYLHLRILKSNGMGKFSRNVAVDANRTNNVPL